MKLESELGKIEQEYLQKLINNVSQPPIFEDPQTQSLYEKFIKASFLMEKEEQETCTRLYVEHIAQVKMPEEWWKDNMWLDKVGQNRNCATRPLEDGITFWSKLYEGIPGLLSKKEVEWLVKEDPRGEGGNSLLFHLSMHPLSTLPAIVATYIHAWK